MKWTVQIKDKNDFNKADINVTIEVNYDSDIEEYVWNEYKKAVIYIDNKFDNNIDRIKLDLLKSYYWDINRIIRREMTTIYPDYLAWYGKDYSHNVEVRQSYEFYVKTDENCYSYGGGDDIYSMNGKDVHVNNNDYKYTPSKKPNDVNKGYTPSTGNSSYSHDSYEDGYNDIYWNEDYDVHRYNTDRDYRNAVDDAMYDAEEDFGDDW